MRTKRLGDMLVEMNLITEEQLQQALKIQKEEHDRLGATLVKHGFITEAQTRCDCSWVSTTST